MHYLNNIKTYRPTAAQRCIAALGITVAMSFTGIAQAQVILPPQKSSPWTRASRLLPPSQ